MARVGFGLSDASVDSVIYRFHNARVSRKCQRCRGALPAIVRTAEVQRALDRDGEERGIGSKEVVFHIEPGDLLFSSQ